LRRVVPEVAEAVPHRTAVGRFVRVRFGMPRSARSTARKLRALSAKHAVAADRDRVGPFGHERVAACASRNSTPASAGPTARAELNTKRVQPDGVDEVFFRHEVWHEREPRRQVHRLDDAVDRDECEYQPRHGEAARDHAREYDRVQQEGGLRGGDEPALRVAVGERPAPGAEEKCGTDLGAEQPRRPPRVAGAVVHEPHERGPTASTCRRTKRPARRSTGDRAGAAMSGRWCLFNAVQNPRWVALVIGSVIRSRRIARVFVVLCGPRVVEEVGAVAPVVLQCVDWDRVLHTEGRLR